MGQAPKTLPAKPDENLPVMHAGGRVAAIVPQSWQEIASIAGAICRAGMAPKSYLVNGIPQPDKVAVAIMHGMEVGMTPMASLQSIAVINGMPGLFGDGLVAVVRASGHLEDIKEGLELDGDGKPTIAWCEVKRKGEASWKRRELTYVQCIRAGWTNKDGPWKLTPGRMMTVRVRGWLLRDMFADVLRGLRSVEEIEDMVDVTPEGQATTTPAAEPQQADYAPKPDPAITDVLPEDQKPAAAASDAPQGGELATDDAAVDDPDLWPERPKPGEKLEFMRFSKVFDFCEYADVFLPKTNKLGAEQFLAMYDGTLIAMEKGKKASQDAAAEYRGMIKKLVDVEPGAEG